MEQSREPVCVAGPIARLGDAMAILAEHNHGEHHLFGAGENGNRSRVIIRRGR